MGLGIRGTKGNAEETLPLGKLLVLRCTDERQKPACLKGALGRRCCDELSGWGHTKEMDGVQKFLQIIEEGGKLKENMSILKRPDLEKWTDTLCGDSRK